MSAYNSKAPLVYIVSTDELGLEESTRFFSQGLDPIPQILNSEPGSDNADVVIMNEVSSELGIDCIEDADIVVMWITEDSDKAAILRALWTMCSLCTAKECGELNKLVIGAPSGVWRELYVNSVCKTAGIQVHDSVPELLDASLGVLQRNFERRTTIDEQLFAELRGQG